MFTSLWHGNPSSAGEVPTCMLPDMDSPSPRGPDPKVPISWVSPRVQLASTRNSNMAFRAVAASSPATSPPTIAISAASAVPAFAAAFIVISELLRASPRRA